jgi:SNF family Na+-dependent transporter
LLLTIEKIPNLLNFPSNNFFEAIKQGFAHTMFSLSVGTGLLYTYAIYSRKQKAFQNSLIVAFFDTLIALISLLVIFSIDVKPDVFLAFENIKKKFIEIDKPLLSYVFFIALFSAGLTSLIAILKFLLDNSDEKILFLAFLLSFFAYFLPKPIIEFADSVIATTLLILSFPLTIFTFSYLIFKK